MNYKIRHSMVSDAHRIYKLCREGMGYDFSEQQVESNIRRLIGSAENLLLVATDEEDNVVGFIHANNHDPVYAPPMKDIVALVIDDDYRHIGIGRQLMDAVEKWANLSGARGIRVNANIDKEGAIAFYKSCGFEYQKTLYNLRKML